MATQNARLGEWWVTTFSLDLAAQRDLNVVKQTMAIEATAYPHYDSGLCVRDGQQLSNTGREAMTRVIQMPLKASESTVATADTVFVVYAGVNLTRSAANAAAMRLARRGGLVHMTEAGEAVRGSRRLGLPSDLYAGPASNSGRSGWPLTARSGLNPRGNYEPIFVPYAAESAFSRPIPVGPFTLWQRATGQQYAARGIINLESGVFTRTGINRTQASWYIIDAGITGTAVAGSSFCWSTTTVNK